MKEPNKNEPNQQNNSKNEDQSNNNPAKPEGKHKHNNYQKNQMKTIKKITIKI